MEAIYIPQLLKNVPRQEKISLDGFIRDLATLTPIRGEMTVKHGGTFLEVKVKAETIITLKCDRCLQQYNHRLCLDTSEIIWLDKEKLDKNYLPLEGEIPLEDLHESLSTDGYFYPQLWLYEQLSLALPLRQICREQCQQPAVNSQEESVIDSRWASLADLKKQLSSS